jgi:2-succinyl-5-enolpyruvyl-6-hydroxy-3-cyclohexene-1-carboxylate synthase
MENQETPVTQNDSNIIHYVAYSLLTLALLVLAYFNFMPQKTQNNPSAQTTQSLEFQDLPYRVQLQYKTNEEFKKVEAKLNAALEEKQAFLKEIAALQEEKGQALQTASQTTQEVIKHEL